MKTILLLLACSQGIMYCCADTSEPPSENPLHIVSLFPGDVEQNGKSYDTRANAEATIYLDHSGSSYTGMNISIINNYDGSGASGNIPSYGINASKGKFITIGADEGTYSTIRTSAASTSASGITLGTLSGQSTVFNTKITNASTYGSCIYSYASLLLWNVHLYMEQAPADGSKKGYGIYASGTNARVTNKDAEGNSLGSLYIHSAGSSESTATLATYNKAFVDIVHATLDVSAGCVLSGGQGGTMALADSTIVSRSSTNTLITGSNYGGATFTLNRVKILESDSPGAAQAKNQRIYVQDFYNTGPVNVNFTATDFHGFSVLDKPRTDTLNITLASNSTWTLSQDSSLGQGTLTVDASSVISFTTINGDFTNINAAAIMLAANTILLLDRESDMFAADQIITLFTGAADDNFTNDGILLVTTDGKSLLYEDLDNGQFKLTGEILDLVPEPSTATLALLGLASLIVRRRKS